MIIATPGRLIALVGNSGVGKSSLVQAGVTVPSLANSAEARFAAGRVLSRHKPEPRGKLSATAEYVWICNCRSDRSGDDRPDPRDGGQTLADWVALVPREDLRLDYPAPPYLL